MWRRIQSLGFRVKALVRREQMERELREELAFHIDMETKKNLEAGMSPDEARRRALLRFGGADRMRERTRASWGVSWLQDAQDDARFALRQLRRRPAFALLAVLTLGLGIGGTVALFNVVDGLLLRALPYEDDDELVSFWSEYNWRGIEYDLVREVAEAYDGLAAYSLLGGSFRTEGRTTTLLTGAVSANLFDVLGAAPLLGRTFRPGEDRPGSEPTLVLGHAFWRQEMGGDPTVIGRRVIYDGTPFTVVGVMPEGFYFPAPEIQAWQTLDLDPGSGEYASNGWLVLVGRVRDGLGPERVQADLDRITAALGERFDYPEAWDKTRGAFVQPLRSSLVGDIRAPLLLLLGAVGLLLLMACANVTALLLSRTADRAGEIAVRIALGAGRLRIARQIFTEAVILGVLSAAAGLGLAVASFDVLVAMLPLRAGFEETLALDWSALFTALGLATAAGSLVSLAPIRSLLKGRMGRGLASARSEAGAVGAPARLQGALVVAEVLLCVVLVSGAALLVRSVSHLRSLDPGLDPTGVLAMDVLMSAEETPQADRVRFFRSLLESVEALPGVRSAGLTNRLPVRDGGWQGTIRVEDRPDLDGAQRPNSYYRTASLRTFQTLGMEIVRGRGFEQTDDATGLPVVVVNETFARRMWGDGDPIGRRISTFFAGAERWLTVVGVVEDTRVHGMVGDMPMVLYQPERQRREADAGTVLVVGADANPTGLVPAIRSVVGELDDRVAVARISTMDDVIDNALAQPLRLRFFLGLFSVLGLVLGSVGIYGVVSYAVSRRRSELGIRLALGAQPRLLVGTVLRIGMAPVGLGVLGGLLVSLALSRLLTSFVYGVAPTDPASLLAAAGILFLAALSASAFPALRAARIQPVTALRAQ